MKGQFAGPVCDKDGICLAYPHGSTWTAGEFPPFASNLKTFVFAFAVSSEEAVNEFDYRVYASSLSMALRAIGYGNAYAEEWGDYAHVIRLLKERSPAITVWQERIDITPVLEFA